MLPLCNQIANFTYTDINYEAISFSYFCEGLKLNAALRKMHLTISINCQIDKVQAFSMIQMFDDVKSEQFELDFSQTGFKSEPTIDSILFYDLRE
jgi:hypothetical protein